MLRKKVYERRDIFYVRRDIFYVAPRFNGKPPRKKQMPWEKVPMASIFIITFRYTYLSAPKKTFVQKKRIEGGSSGLIRK